MIGLALIIAAEFDQQRAASMRKQLDVFRVELFFLHVLHEMIVEAFKTDGLMREHFHDMIASRVDIGITQNDQRTRWRARDEAHGCFQHRHTSAFATDERARHVKAMLRQELGEVITRDAARDIGKALAY